MLVRLSDTQEVNTDHVVNVATPNANQPDEVTISLSNGRQIKTDADGAESLRRAMNAWAPYTPPGDPVATSPDQTQGGPTTPDDADSRDPAF